MNNFLDMILSSSALLATAVTLVSMGTTIKQLYNIKKDKNKYRDKIKENIRHTITDVDIQERYIENLMEERELEKLEKRLKELEELEKKGFKA